MHLVMRRLISQVDRTLEVQPTAHKCVAPALGAMHLVMRRLISQVDRTWKPYVLTYMKDDGRR